MRQTLHPLWKPEVKLEGITMRSKSRVWVNNCLNITEGTYAIFGQAVISSKEFARVHWLVVDRSRETLPKPHPEIVIDMLHT